MDIHDWPYIKKSARRKKRLVKKDFDKQLFWLDRERQRIGDLIDKLPPIMLDKPQQRGLDTRVCFAPGNTKGRKRGVLPGTVG